MLCHVLSGVPGTMNRDRGFTILEVLIVVAIILLIAGIAIPNMMRAKQSANEASATSSLRMLNQAEVTFSASYSSGYTEGLNRLGPPSAGQPAGVDRADLVDPILAGLSPGGSDTGFLKSGYIFVYTPATAAFGTVAAYQITADPQARGSTGRRSFFTNEPLVIRSNPTAAATVGDPPI